MSEAIVSEKRTRSQLTLPDEILQLSQRSPLKDARTALRNNLSNLAESTPQMCTEITEGTDDELLLTSRTHFSTKRSASPLRDEYSSHPDSPSEGRELKRIRHGLNVESDIVLKTTSYATSSSHFRSHSQPNIWLGQKVERSSADAPLSPKPASSSITRPPTTNVVLRGKGRAQSVPLFPSTSAVPHLDLRNPPPSPVRARSRSPLKDWEPRMRIVFGVSTIAELDSKEGSSMVMGSNEIKSPIYSLAPRPPTPNATETAAPMSTVEDVIETNSFAPSTPAGPERLLSTQFWSPLTPLPETPYPSKTSSHIEERYTGIGWGNELDEGDKAQEIIANHILQGPSFAGTDEGSLAPPSNSSTDIVFSDAMGPPTPARVIKGSTSMKNITTQSGQSSGLLKLPLATAKRSTEASGNAFTFMMAQARLDKVGDRSMGAGKERGSHKKITSSSAKMLNVSQAVKEKGKGQATGKGVEKEAQAKPSLKAKMRPKQLPKAKPVLVPTLNPALQDGHENTLTPLNVPSLDSPAKRSLPTLFSKSPVTPTVTESKISSPRSLPPKTFSSLSLPSSGASRFQPGVVGPKAAESSPTTNISAGEVADGGERLGNPPEFQPTSNPISTITTSKLPRARRVPSSSIAEGVTRRVSSRLKGKDAMMSNTVARKVVTTKQARNSKKLSHSANKSKQFFSAPKVSQDPMASTSSLSDVPSDSIPGNTISPGSPMKLASPVRKDTEVQEPLIQPGFTTTAKAALSRTPSKPKTKAKSESPSPSKLSRSTSMFSIRSTALSRTVTSYGGHSGQSSLSTLSNALEKLRMPPPARPNTSMGFNRDSGNNTDDIPVPRVQDTDDLLPQTESGQMIKATGLGSGAVLGSSSRQSVKGKIGEPSQKPVPGSDRASSTTRLQSGTGPIMRSIGSGNVHGSRPIFGTSGRLFRAPGRVGALQKVSRKTSLPSVIASPVKGSHAADTMSRKGDEMDGVFDDQNGCGQEASVDQDTVVGATEKGGGQGQERYPGTQRHLASRRASLASQALSQSLSSLPLAGGSTPGVGSMGPPVTPPGRSGMRSTSSSYPTTSLPSSSGKTPNDEILPKTRSAVRGVPGAPVDGHPSYDRKQSDDAGTGTSKSVAESWKVLHDCVIFVDVRTDDGDEAGSLFVEMLESVGARILTRVGQTCTHIVYKNGLVSTSTRYRLLRDPKPVVVGIAWVVECVEQRQRVDESKFAIDLDNINVAGVNKRRRSMLPKAILREVEDASPNIDREGDDDRSMDGSSSTMIIDDDLTPLEKARRRKGAL